MSPEPAQADLGAHPNPARHDGVQGDGRLATGPADGYNVTAFRKTEPAFFPGGAMLLAELPTQANPYLDAVATIEQIPQETATRRLELGITTTEQADQIGIGLATLLRLEAGSVPIETTIVRCLRWLAQ